MVRASSRLLFLLTNPTSLLHHRTFSILRVAHRHSLACPLATLSAAPNYPLFISRVNSTFPIKLSQSYYSRATNNSFQEYNHSPANDYRVSPSHPWPEWSRLLESLSVAGYFNWSSNIEDEFVANENLSMEFVAAANSCLAFARDRPDILRWLPRKDIEVLINDGYPLLFQSAHETERRMRSFLQAEGSNEARSVDLMKYILSYTSNHIIYPEKNINQPTESSVRSLLQEMANLSHRSRSSEQYQATSRDEQIPRNPGPNITMKKGDWICPKCNFMNFARNTKCLECEEVRPSENPRFNNTIERGQNDRNAPFLNTMETNLETDKEDKTERWFKKMKELHNVDNKKTEIPFSPKQQPVSSSTYVPFVPFPPNYFSKKDDISKNPVQESVTGNLDSRPYFEDKNIVIEETNTGSASNQLRSLEGSAVTESDPLDMSEEAKAERWFRRVAQIKDISELSEIPDEDFPSFMPMRKGMNRFVVSKRKTPLERRLTSPQYRKNLRIMSSERKREGDDDD